VGQPYGLEGFVKVRPPSGETGHLLGLSEVIVDTKGNEKTLVVEESRALGAQALLKFRGVDSPEAAKSLAGAALLADRAHAAPLAENEFYIEDLKGLAVLSGGSGQLGLVADAVEGGGGWLLEIELSSGEKRLVPFRNEFFGPMDQEKRTIVLLAEWVFQ
jgi:16S rRNA processing protein RimM